MSFLVRVLSIIIAGIGCAFAGLCYAELAAMVPVAGSAYTYAYAGAARHRALPRAERGRPAGGGHRSHRTRWCSPVVKVSAVLGLFSTILVQLLGQTRIFYSMSRDGLLPAVFGRVHARSGTPLASTLIVGAVVTVAAGLLPIGVLGQLVSIGTLFAFVLVCVGIAVLRRTAPSVTRPFRSRACPGCRPSAR